MKINSQSIISSIEEVTILKCSFCNNSLFAVKLPVEKQEEKKFRTDEIKRKKILGKKICNSCKNNGFNGEKFEFFEDRKNEKGIATKSYVLLNIRDQKQYSNLRVRDLSV